jgi:hypothetical protein
MLAWRQSPGQHTFGGGQHMVVERTIFGHTLNFDAVSQACFGNGLLKYRRIIQPAYN